MLVSRLLSSNSRLQRCAVEHPSHVQRGDSGPHVRLIQIALMVLDNADIDAGEASASTFGPSTEQAVLAYKTTRRIINLSYQTKPDAVVGIMTIRALDAEIALHEAANSVGAYGQRGVQVRTRRGR